MNAFALWPHPEVYPHTLPMEEASRDTPKAFAQAWLNRFQGYDYGAMTVWLMRGFGLPNVRAYNTGKHSFCWGLETPEGYVISVSPGLLRVDSDEWKAAPNERDEHTCSRADWVKRLAYASVFDIQKVREDAPPLSDALFEQWLTQFARPVYVRDVGATVMGPLGFDEDVGPGHPSVLDGGAEVADEPTVPKRSASAKPS